MFVERLREVVWLLDYVDDLESDFSAIHRVDDIYAMDAPRFFRLAVRLTAYEGVMAARRMAEDQKQNGGAVNTGQTREVQATRTALQHDPALAGLVSVGGA